MGWGEVEGVMEDGLSHHETQTEEKCFNIHHEVNMSTVTNHETSV